MSDLENPRGYNNPNDTDMTGAAVESGIGKQARTDHWIKKALIEARKTTYFMPLSNTVGLPKHMGKTIKKFHYMPLLDDENVNSEGIDAAGVVLNTGTFAAYKEDGTQIITNADVTGGYYSSAGLAQTEADAYVALAPTVNRASVVENGGNLYGSSKDPGTISGKLPAIGANGGRKNRVGFKRKEVKGSITKMGFFDEYNQESLDFDSDADLQQHINREMINGAHEMTEDALQIDLLNEAGTREYADDAMNMSEISGAAKADRVQYGDLLKLSIDLDQNRTPKQTKIITGTRNVDTRTIAGGRVMYIGAELQPTLEGMEDLHKNPAFIHVHQYAAAGTTLNGEIGTVGHFRMVVVPEMMSYAGAGATVDGGGDECYETNNKYDVLPMLVVGSGSFSTIGFQTDGKTVKFKIIHKPPGEETADRNEPYGEIGFMSIKWYYGFLAERPERLAVYFTAATL